MSSVHSIGAAKAPSLISAINPLLRRLLGIGLPFGPNVLLTVRGRTSGQLRTFPVAILELDGRRYIQSPFGEVNWVRNLRANGEAILAKGRDRQQVEAIELSPEAAGPVLRRALAPQLRTPFGAMMRRYFRFGADGTPEEDVAEARRHPTFELRPRRTAPGRGGG
jgi:deazaflavin-dependent oxidoreductase (nitroreductase family)